MNKVIKKITANNGGVFTGNGTNAYLIGHEDITLVDPGPNSTEHIDRILLEGGDKIKRILVTHTHTCLLYTSPSPRDKRQSRMPSSA